MKSHKENGNRAADALAQLTETALKNYEQVVRTGLRMQEEAGRYWSSVLESTSCAGQSWDSHLAARLRPFAEQRTQEMVEWLQRSGRANADLMRKAVEAAETQDAAQRQAQWFDLWAASMSTLRAQAEAVTGLSSRALEAWADLVQSRPAGSRTAA